MLRALSIRQPWAFLILRGERHPFWKDVENRSRRTLIRGPIYLHAAQTIDQHGYALAARLGIAVPDAQTIPRGGLVGLAEIIDCVRDHPSPWFTGPWGYVLSNPRTVPFRPMPGQLGFFLVPLPGTSKNGDHPERREKNNDRAQG